MTDDVEQASASTGTRGTAEGDLSGVSLRYRDLRGADLSKAQGLMAWSLAGSDLRGARLPSSLEFDLLRRAEEAAKLSQKHFLILAGAAFACWLVRISTSDADMALASAHANLPLFDIGINITYFYFLSPLLILAIYVYFHLGLQRLWECVVNLPMFFPDGLRIDKKIYPWPLARISELVFPTLWNKASRFTRGRVLLTVGLFWVVVPLSLLAYWLHFIQQHNLWISLWHVGLLMLSFVVDLLFATRFVQLLEHSRKEDKKGSVNRLAAPKLPLDLDGLRCHWSLIRWRSLALAVALTAGAAVYTYAVVEGQFHFPRGITTFNVEAGVLEGANLRGRDLDGMVARRADFRGADLTDASLHKADLTDAVLEGADLRGADLVGAFYELGAQRLPVTPAYLEQAGATFDSRTRFSEASPPEGAEPLR